MARIAKKIETEREENLQDELDHPMCANPVGAKFWSDIHQRRKVTRDIGGREITHSADCGNWCLALATLGRRWTFRQATRIGWRPDMDHERRIRLLIEKDFWLGREAIGAEKVRQRPRKSISAPSKTVRQTLDAILGLDDEDEAS